MTTLEAVRHTGVSTSYSGKGPGSKVSTGTSKCHMPTQCVLNLENLTQIL